MDSSSAQSQDEEVMQVTQDCLVALSHRPRYIVPELLTYRKAEMINEYVFKLLNVC